MNIGFIGLGDIGFPMARRLANHGIQVFSCANRRRQAIEALKADGFVEKDNPREVAEHADVLITMVVDDKQTDSIVRGTAGALTGLKPGSILIVMSTLSPSYCIELAKEAADRGITMLDCPVSGGRIGAEKGTLALMLGGKLETIERCRAILELMGTIQHCGDVGMGQVVKLANNAILLTTISVVREACVMAKSHGINSARLMEILTKSTGQSFVTDHWEYIIENWPHFRELGRKDTGLCIDTANENNISLPLIEALYSQDWNSTL